MLPNKKNPARPAFVVEKKNTPVRRDESNDCAAPWLAPNCCILAIKNHPCLARLPSLSACLCAAYWCCHHAPLKVTPASLPFPYVCCLLVLPLLLVPLFLYAPPDLLLLRKALSVGGLFFQSLHGSTILLACFFLRPCSCIAYGRIR